MGADDKKGKSIFRSLKPKLCKPLLSQHTRKHRPPSTKTPGTNINPPDPPPYYNHASMTYFPPMGMGVSANHVPMAPLNSIASPSSSNNNNEGFNVWCINGYSGFVQMPHNNDATETLGRLETLNQVMRGSHNYSTGMKNIPRPPTPSAADKAKAKSEKHEDVPPRPPTPKAAAAVVKEVKFAGPAPPPGYGKPEECQGCQGAKLWFTKKIKRNEMVMCWGCVSEHFHVEAERVWWES